MSRLELLALVAIVVVFLGVAGDLTECCRRLDEAEQLPDLDDTLAYVASEYAAEARLKGWQR